MLQLPKEAKLQLYKLLRSKPDLLGNINGEMGLISFLERIWDLRLMPSTDDRFKDAYGDAVQHLVNNDDWEIDFVFLDRFDLLGSDEHFNKFLEVVVSPLTRQNEDDIIKYILLIEPFISKYDYIFQADHIDAIGLPVYKLVENKEGSDFLFGLTPNKIPFFVDWNKQGRSDVISSHTPPQAYPSFVLVYNDGWNDYGIHSAFDLFFYDEKKTPVHIGSTKIISNLSDRGINFDLPSQFQELTSAFCSLGQSLQYYGVLKSKLPKHFESILFAIRDAALFPDNHDRFEKDSRFKASLLRSDNAERVLRTARLISYGYQTEDIYNFRYNFRPRYSDDPIDINFDFSKPGMTGNRIYAIIGKNGAGKTQLITSLPIDISGKNGGLFFPLVPFFSKVLAVSYSVFDKFEIPKKTASFNYVYCGLRKEDSEPLSDKGLVLRFYNSWKKLQTVGRLDGWRKVLVNFMNLELINSFIVGGDVDNNEPLQKIDPVLFQQAKAQFSSGQSIIFYIITEIVANIRYDSLLLFDEPETHLHPNAITELINAIYELVEEFQSYCIIATHSPVIIRELFSRNVYVLEREDNIPLIRNIGIESFGEDIGVLTDEVFGNKEIPKRYKKIIDGLCAIGLSFETIVARLENDNFPLGLNVRLYIRSAVNRRDA